MKKLLMYTSMIVFFGKSANGIEVNNYPGLEYSVILSINCNSMKICNQVFKWDKKAHNWTHADQFNIIPELQKYKNIEAVDIKIQTKGQLMDCLYTNNINKDNKTDILNKINKTIFNLSLSSGGWPQCTLQ